MILLSDCNIYHTISMSENEQNLNDSSSTEQISSLSASENPITETVTTQSALEESQPSAVSELQTESSVSNITGEEEEEKNSEVEESSEEIDSNIPKLLPSSSFSSSQSKKKKRTKRKSSSTASTGSQNMTKRQRRMLSHHDKTIKILEKSIKTLTRKFQKFSKTVPRCGK